MIPMRRQAGPRLTFRTDRLESDVEALLNFLY